MNWLLRPILDAHLKLTPEQLDAVKRRAREYAAREPWAWLRTMLPGFAALIAPQFWPQLRKTFPLGWYLAFEVAFTLAVLAAVFWLLRRTYTRYAYRAVHELGFANICPRCGYDHTGLGEQELECPECGEERRPAQETPND